VDLQAVNLSQSKPPTKFLATCFVRLRAKTEKPRKEKQTRLLRLQARRKNPTKKSTKSLKRPKRRRKRKRKKRRTGIRRRRRNIHHLKERPDLYLHQQNLAAFNHPWTNGTSVVEKCLHEKTTKGDTDMKNNGTEIITDLTMITITTVKANGQNLTVVIETIEIIMKIIAVVGVIIGMKTIGIGEATTRIMTENITTNMKIPEEVEETDIKAKIGTRNREEQTDIGITMIIGIIAVGIDRVIGMIVVIIIGHPDQLDRMSKGHLKDPRLTMKTHSGIPDGREWKCRKKPKLWKSEESISLTRKENERPR